MTGYDHIILTKIDAEGIALGTIYQQGRASNVIDQAILDALEAFVGSITGTRHVEGDLRCVSGETGLGDAEGIETCSPVYGCDDAMVSVNADASIHSVHHVE